MRKKGIDEKKIQEVARGLDIVAYKEQQYDKLAAGLREALDMEYIYEVMGLNGSRNEGE